MTYREQLDMNRIPAHIAIIMDGNGRWAKQYGHIRSYGHQAGAETVHTIAEEASKYDNFRIKIGRDDTVSDVEVQNLVAASLQFNNVTLLKVSPPITNTVTPEDIKESEERKKRMSEFEGLTFNQITKKFVKENLNASITDEQIADVLLND